MSSTLRSTLLAAAIAAITIGAQAQEVKIGMVNPERILSEAAPAKAATARLKNRICWPRSANQQRRQRLESGHRKIPKRRAHHGRNHTQHA